MSQELNGFEISASDDVFDINETEETPKDVPLKKKSTGSKPKKSTKKKEAIGSIPGGAIGIKKVEDETKKDKSVDSKKTKPETVAVHSTKNVSWPNVGKVYRGYNIVEKEIADKWLTRDHIRTATPEEVAREFGVI